MSKRRPPKRAKSARKLTSAERRAALAKRGIKIDRSGRARRGGKFVSQLAVNRAIAAAQRPRKPAPGPKPKPKPKPKPPAKPPAKPRETARETARERKLRERAERAEAKLHAIEAAAKEHKEQKEREEHEAKEKKERAEAKEKEREKREAAKAAAVAAKAAEQITTAEDELRSLIPERDRKAWLGQKYGGRWRHTPYWRRPAVEKHPTDPSLRKDLWTIPVQLGVYLVAGRTGEGARRACAKVLQRGNAFVADHPDLSYESMMIYRILVTVRSADVKGYAGYSTRPIRASRGKVQYDYRGLAGEERVGGQSPEAALQALVDRLQDHLQDDILEGSPVVYLVSLELRLETLPLRPIAPPRRKR